MQPTMQDHPCPSSALPPFRLHHVNLNVLTQCSCHLQVLKCLALDPRVAAANLAGGHSQNTPDCSALSMQAAHATYRSPHTIPGSKFSRCCAHAVSVFSTRCVCSCLQPRHESSSPELHTARRQVCPVCMRS